VRPASSPRSRLARIALQAATGLPEIAAGASGPRRVWATADAGELLEGVVVTARPDARFDVELHLVAQWPLASLLALGDEVRARVRRAARAAELEGLLGRIDVAFEDVSAG
jgi:hypothetical protein